MILDQFVIDQLFDRIDTVDGELVYYARTKDEEGYIVVWPLVDGRTEHLHTYRYPPDWL